MKGDVRAETAFFGVGNIAGNALNLRVVERMDFDGVVFAEHIEYRAGFADFIGIAAPARR